MDNIFAISGDWPRPGRRSPPSRPSSTSTRCSWPGTIAALRGAGGPFFISCAVSPFKYVSARLRVAVPEAREEDRRGRRLAITQVGWDAAKFGELRRYLGRARPQDAGARQRVRARPPCRRADDPRRAARVLGVADELEAVRARKPGAQDGGLQARLERAARHGGGAARARLRRRLPRRNPRRGARSRGSSGAREELGPTLGGAGRRAAATASTAASTSTDSRRPGRSSRLPPAARARSPSRG